MGPVGFSFGIKAPLQRAHEEIKELVANDLGREAGDAYSIWAYLHDVIAIIPPSHIGRAVEITLRHLSTTGYQANIGKLEVWGPTGPPPQLEARLADSWRDDGLIILGGPVSNDDYSEAPPAGVGTPTF